MHTCVSIYTQTYLHIHINKQAYSGNEFAHIRRPCKDLKKVLQRQQRQDGSEWDMLPLPLCLSVHISWVPAPPPVKVHTVTCEVQSVPLYKHTVHKTDRKMFCMRQEKLLREMLRLQLCGSDSIITMISSVLQISEQDSWATEVTEPGFGAAWGHHCSRSCSLMKMCGFKNRILKYRCTWPGKILKRQKVHFESFILQETEILP